MGTGLTRVGANGKTPKLQFPVPRSAYHKPRRAVCTWLAAKDYELFAEIAKLHGVTVSTYLRAVLNDVIAEESANVKTLFTE